MLIFNFYNERFPSVYFRVFVTFSCFLNNFFCFVFFSSIFGNICSFFRFKPQNFQINTRNNDINISATHHNFDLTYWSHTANTTNTQHTAHTTRLSDLNTPIVQKEQHSQAAFQIRSQFQKWKRQIRPPPATPPSQSKHSSTAILTLTQWPLSIVVHTLVWYLRMLQFGLLQAGNYH